MRATGKLKISGESSTLIWRRPTWKSSENQGIDRFASWNAALPKY
jgi:hypothetical protein